MDLGDLRVFRAVAEAGGVTRAAERLHRVPSNITTRVRQLEDELGILLFHRESRGLRLTPAGDTLLGYAERLDGLVAEALEALHGGTPSGRLRLGAMESTAATRLPALLAQYHMRHPQVAMDLATGPTRQLLGQMLRGELEAVLVADCPADARIDSTKVFEEELVLVCAAGHRPIRRPEDVAPPALLAFAAGCAYRDRLERWFGASGRTPERVQEVSSYHALLGCAVAGMGVALIPRSVLDIFPGRDGLSEHRPSAAVRHSVTFLAWRKGAVSPRLSALQEILGSRQDRSRRATTAKRSPDRRVVNE